MRTKCKFATKVGHSRAAMYRASVFSAASDIEALVDAYGVTAITDIAMRVSAEIAHHGDSINNYNFNLWLNSLPLPAIRKQNNPENKRRSKRKS